MPKHAYCNACRHSFLFRSLDFWYMLVDRDVLYDASGSRCVRQKDVLYDASGSRCVRQKDVLYDYDASGSRCVRKRC